jgi:hypothetical protein
METESCSAGEPARRRKESVRALITRSRPADRGRRADRRQEVRLLGGVDHFPTGRVGVLEVHADGTGGGEPLDQLRRREPVATFEVDGYRKAH